MNAGTHTHAHTHPLAHSQHNTYSLTRAHSYSIARHVQKHARLIAVIESMDNGKPIRETRDADTQVVARHLYHYAGWAQVCLD